MAILTPDRFDGVNRVITLMDGETNVDVFEDIYEGAKDWYLGHPDNRKHPFPFVSDGGNPLTSVINQGGYIFLDNISGWRLRPPEEDITVYLTGNLAVLTTDLPAFVPTVGAFTAAILGLQPVTQGVVPEMKTNLAFATYQNQVVFDPLNASGRAVAGTGTDGNGVEIGTRRAPSNNIDDVLTILQTVGLVNIALASNFIGVAETTDLSAGYNWVGDGPGILCNIPASMNVTNNRFENISMAGELDGVNLIKDSFVGNVTNFSGVMFNVTIDGDISINGKSRFLQCFSDREGAGYSRIIDIGTNAVMVRDMRGSIGLAGITGGNHSIGIGGGGRTIVEASCTGGNVYLRGAPYDWVDGGGGATVIDQTESRKNTEIWQMARMDPDNPRETDEDGTIRVAGKTIGASTVGTTPNRTTTQTRTG